MGAVKKDMMKRKRDRPRKPFVSSTSKFCRISMSVPEMAGGGGDEHHQPGV